MNTGQGSHHNILIGGSSNIIDGHHNIVIGPDIVVSGANNIVIGHDHNVVGNNNIIVDSTKGHYIRGNNYTITGNHPETNLSYSDALQNISESLGLIQYNIVKR
jgi:hypothetical protein